MGLSNQQMKRRVEYTVKVPDGLAFSKIAKIEWIKEKNPVSPYFVEIPQTLKSVSFIVKDSKRFPDTHGWAFAQFAYDAGSETSRSTLQGRPCRLEQRPRGS